MTNHSQLNKLLSIKSDWSFMEKFSLQKVLSESFFHELRHKEAENENKKEQEGKRVGKRESGSHTAHCLNLF